jgi:tripartite-type tricarboxylate transporter receptor subunit TctC
LIEQEIEVIASIRHWLLAACLAMFGPTPLALADDSFPSHSIELVTHRTAGSTFQGAKIIADGLASVLGVPVVVTPKAAGGGTIAPASVASAKPDGYTLLVANSGSNGTVPTIMPVTYKNSDFHYLAMYGTQPMTLVVKSDARWKTLQDLVADVKANPGKFNYATSSVGAQSHFLMEMFKVSAGNLKIEQVPFRGAPESVQAILGGHVEIGSTYLADVKGQVDAGLLRILAVPEEKRIAAYPNVPTFAESGYADVVSTAWFGIAAPAGTPKSTTDKLEAALRKVIEDPEVKKRLTTIGYMPTYLDGEQFTQFVAAQEALFTRVARQAAIKIN